MPLRRQWLPVVGMFVGVWAALPRFVSPDLNVAESREVADHVVPAILVITLSAVALVLARRGAAPAMFMFVAGLAVCLAGLWMVATHVPLVAQAARADPGVTWAATTWHSAAAAAVAILGIVWTATYWDAVSADTGADTGADVS
ncbi:MAG: hypothetical protein M3159_08945 [Actinomycetota bacterium]|nr:hypothetical protein [Actinomycetota bacterium]